MFTPILKRLPALMLGGFVAITLIVANPFSAQAEVAPAISTTAAPSTQALPALTQLIKQNRDAVVNIAVNGSTEPTAETELFALPDGMPKEMERFFRNLPRQLPQFRERQAMGSGFIVSPDGYIVTNAHVINNGKDITVTLNDHRELKATVIGKDDYSDIALLKIEADQLPTVQFGNSDGLEVGQWVVAIGAPFGLEHSATQGIVSALSRSLPDGTYVPFIQTDVAVNPGNSGGPLFDLAGNVVGVNSQIYSRSGGYMGISFAIPSNLVKNITDQIKSAGHVSRGWLGVEIQTLDQALANSFSMPRPYGALVASVKPASPADKAGIQAGDVITQFNNTEVNSANHLPLLVGSTPIGQQVPITVLRNGKVTALQVTVEQLAETNDKEPELAQHQATEGSLGLAVAPLTAEERTQANLGDTGVKVEQVHADSPAARAGVQTGDVIIAIDNQTIRTPDELKTKVEQTPTDKPLAVLIMRNEQKRFIAITRS